MWKYSKFVNLKAEKLKLEKCKNFFYSEFFLFFILSIGLKSAPGCCAIHSSELKMCKL